MFFRSKKGVTELTSFVFITFIIIVASTTAYVISNSYLDDTIKVIDRDNMEIYMKKLNKHMSRVTTFDNTTYSFSVKFNTGQLRFVDNQIYYQSEIEFEDSDTYCYGNVCYMGVAGFERIYTNLTSPYSFSTNQTLEPDDYILIFQNRKEQNEVRLRFR